MTGIPGTPDRGIRGRVGAVVPARVHWTVEAWQRKSSDYVVPREIEVLIVSPGGVASTLLIEQIGRFLATNDAGDADGLKHRIRPPREMEGRRAVLLTGDPDSIWRSLTRRDYQDAQAIRLGLPSYFWSPLQRQERMLKQAVLTQRERWGAVGPAVVTTTFDRLWDDLPRIADHLDLQDTDFIARFPPRRERSS